MGKVILDHEILSVGFRSSSLGSRDFHEESAWGRSFQICPCWRGKSSRTGQNEMLWCCHNKGFSPRELLCWDGPEELQIWGNRARPFYLQFIQSLHMTHTQEQDVSLCKAALFSQEPTTRRGNSTSYEPSSINSHSNWESECSSRERGR